MGKNSKKQLVNDLKILSDQCKSLGKFASSKIIDNIIQDISTSNENTDFRLEDYISIVK